MIKTKLRTITLMLGLALMAMVSAANVGAVNSPVQLNLSNDLLVTGCAAPGAFVSLLVDNVLVGTSVAGSDGRFTRTHAEPNPWIHNVKSYYQDVSGRTSATSSEDVSIAPHVVTPYDVLLSPTVSVSPAIADSGADIVFSGLTCPDAVVTVTLDGNFVLTTQANSAGEWTIRADTTNYFIGTHVFDVTSSLGAQISDESEQYSFQITTPQPQSQVPENNNNPSIGIPIVTAPTITSPEDRYVTSKESVVVSGEAEPGSQIEIFIDGEIAGSVFANFDGKWSFTLSMTEGQHTVKARSCVEELCSDFSDSITVVYNGDPGLCELDFKLSEYRFPKLFIDEGVDIAMSIERVQASDYEVLVDWGDSTIERFSLVDSSTRNMHHVYDSTGQKNGSVTVTDASGCNHTQYFSVNVLMKSGSNWYWYIPPIVFVIIAGWLLKKKLRK